MNIIEINDRNRHLFEKYLPSKVKEIYELGVVYDDLVVGGVRLDFRKYAIHILSMEIEKEYEQSGIHAVLKYVYQLAKASNYPVIVMAAFARDEYALRKYRKYGFSFIKSGARYSFRVADLKDCVMVNKLLKASGENKDITLERLSPMQLKTNPMLKELMTDKRVMKELSTVTFADDKLQSMCIVGKSYGEDSSSDLTGLELMYLYGAKNANMQLLSAIRESFNRVCENYSDNTVISCTTTGDSSDNLLLGFDIPNICVTDTLYYGNAFLTDFKKLLDIFDKRYV